MNVTTTPDPQLNDPNHCEVCACFARSMAVLTDAGVPFLVGGGFAVEVYVDAPRAKIKDLDVFLRPRDVGRALQALTKSGFRTHLHEPAWIAKAYDGDTFIDLIYCTRNGLLRVDDESFRGAPDSTVLGQSVKLQPVEEVIATKVFVAARDRFDASDISHLILRCADRIDWRRLIDRMAPYVEMLNVHLQVFAFLYPGLQHLVPAWARDEVAERAERLRARAAAMPEDTSRGLALDPVAFAIDIEQWGFFDARQSDSLVPERTSVAPHGNG